MFGNLTKRVEKRIERTIANQVSVMNTTAPKVTPAMIHADFYGAEERLFVDAVGKMVTGLDEKEHRANRMKAIGFGRSKEVTEVLGLKAASKESNDLVSCIEYFRVHYPCNKFITEKEAEKLCKKYGLNLGDASQYIGDMPEKNLSEVEAFNLRKEDYVEKRDFWGSLASLGYDRLVAEYMSISQHQQSQNIFGSTFIQGYDPFSQRSSSRMDMQRNPLLAQSSQRPKEKEYEKPAFKICAPPQDFQTALYELVDGYKLVYDPIVLQPVKKNGIDGYLIVTAWGEEKNDELVVNQGLN